MPVVYYQHPEYNAQDINTADVALMWIASPGPTPSNYLKLAPNSALWALEAGQEVGTLGFPGEIEGSSSSRSKTQIATFKLATISAVRPYQDWMSVNGQSNKLIQHSLDLTPGTSGSPIFNRRGEVVGANFAGFSDTSLGFGIRADEIRESIRFLAFHNGRSYPNTKTAVGEIPVYPLKRTTNPLTKPTSSQQNIVVKADRVSKKPAIRK
jgi:S1-C subfamily serine protease